MAQHRRQQVLDWQERYGKTNEHNGWVPRDFWLEEWEKQAIVGFHLKNRLEGYRRLTFMMLDADIVAVSAGTSRSKPSASGREHRCRSMMDGVWCRIR